MFKKIFIFVLGCGLLLTACNQKKSDSKKEETKKGVVTVKFINNPLPQFSVLFNKLDNLVSADFDKAIVKRDNPDVDDVYKTAYQLGALTADAVIAAKARNKTVLQESSKQMIEYSKLVGLSDNILKLSDELQNLIENDKWELLTKKLDAYKVDVELSLYDTGEYDLFTILQLGGWNEGLNRICFLLNDKYERKQSEFISQKGITNALLQNLKQIENQKLKETEFYKVSIENFEKIKTILYSSEDNTFTKEQVNELFELTNQIVKTFK